MAFPPSDRAHGQASGSLAPAWAPVSDGASMSSTPQAAAPARTSVLGGGAGATAASAAPAQAPFAPSAAATLP